MYRRLQERSKSTGIAISEQIRRAIEKDLGLQQSSLDITDRLEDIEALLRHSVAKKEDEGAISFSMSPDDRRELETLSGELGFAQVAHLVQSLAEKALDHGPGAVQEWLTGDVTRELEARLEAKLAKEEVKRKRKAA